MFEWLFGNKKPAQEVVAEKTYSGCPDYDNYKADNVKLMSELAVKSARIFSLTQELEKANKDALEAQRINGICTEELTKRWKSAVADEQWARDKLLKARKKLRDARPVRKKKLTK